MTITAQSIEEITDLDFVIRVPQLALTNDVGLDLPLSGDLICHHQSQCSDCRDPRPHPTSVWSASTSHC